MTFFCRFYPLSLGLAKCCCLNIECTCCALKYNKMYTHNFSTNRNIIFFLEKLAGMFTMRNYLVMQNYNVLSFNKGVDHGKNTPPSHGISSHSHYQNVGVHGVTDHFMTKIRLLVRTSCALTNDLSALMQVARIC